MTPCHFDHLMKPAIAIRGSIFIFGSGMHGSVLPHIFRCSWAGILWVLYLSSFVTLSGTTKEEDLKLKFKKLRHFYS